MSSLSQSHKMIHTHHLTNILITVCAAFYSNLLKVSDYFRYMVIFFHQNMLIYRSTIQNKPVIRSMNSVRFCQLDGNLHHEIETNVYLTTSRNLVGHPVKENVVLPNFRFTLSRIIYPCLPTPFEKM